MRHGHGGRWRQRCPALEGRGEVADVTISPWPFVPLQPFAYDLIVVDFPWSFETWSGAGKNYKSPERHYETMTIAEIAAMPLGHLGGRDAVYVIWATHPMIDQQIALLPGWGLRLATSGVWVKRTRTGKL